MKTLAATLLISLTLGSSFVQAEEKKPDPDKDFATIFTIMMVMSGNCPEYDLVKGGAARYMDTHGVDPDIAVATENATRAIYGLDYDRSKLIASVTRYVREEIIDLEVDMRKKGKPTFCREFGPSVVKNGFLKKKEDKKPAVENTF